MSLVSVWMLEGVSHEKWSKPGSSAEVCLNYMSAGHETYSECMVERMELFPQTFPP